jgi:hypothetical protein
MITAENSKKLNHSMAIFKKIDMSGILNSIDARLASVEAGNLGANAVSTSEIANGAVTLAKLEATVQTSLGKANSALQNATAFATAAQGAKADTAIQTVPVASTVAAIATPAAATAEDCANKVNAVIAALKAAGLMA